MLGEPASDHRPCRKAAPNAASADIAAAIAATTDALAIEDLWADALEIAVDPAAAKSDSDELSRQRTLRKAGGRLLLSVIWKESAFVPVADLQKAGGVKRTSAAKPLTCHGMAVALTEHPAELDAQCKRVTKLVAAAVHYGMVTVTPAPGNKKVVEGTALLHDVMMTFASSVRMMMVASAEEAQ